MVLESHWRQYPASFQAEQCHHHSFIHKKPPPEIILLYTEIHSSCHSLLVSGLLRGWRTSATKPPVLRFFHPSQTSAAGCTVPAALAKSFILGQVPRNPVKTWTARIQEAAAPSTLGRDAPNAVDIVRYNTNLLISELWVHPVKR